MPTTIDKRAFLRLMKAETFTPTDCPNFITYRDYDQYRWYARVLAPLLLATGGGPMFVGNRLATLYGESPCEVWMVVRYPTHRGMLRMIVNPYYVLAANPFRERGTARLELAFTQPRTESRRLAREPLVLGVHADAGDSAQTSAFFASLRALAARAGLEVVYEAECRYSFDFVRNPRPVDPNPLTFPTQAVVAGGSAAALEAFAADEAVRSLLGAQPRACAQLYERGDKLQYLRFG